MKVPGTDVDIRITEPSEKIELYAHSGECRYCGGVVKMPRNMKGRWKGRLQPDKC